MAGCITQLRSTFRVGRAALLVSMLATLAACNEQSDTAEPAVLTGRIEALDEASLGFRITGRMIERTVNVGDQVKAGQLLGRLEPLNEMNALRAAKANLAAAQAKLTQVSNHFDRQETLLTQGWTTRANFDQAKRELQTAQAQVEVQ